MKTKYKVTLLILSIVIIGLIVFNKCSNDKKVYILKEHNPDGKLIGANEYIIRNGDTVLQGKFVRYNEKGIKIAEGQFADNEPTGICSYYFDNGKIRTVYYRKDSKINPTPVVPSPNPSPSPMPVPSPQPAPSPRPNPSPMPTHFPNKPRL